MKKTTKIILYLFATIFIRGNFGLIWFSSQGVLAVEEKWRWNYGSDPIRILDKVVANANDDRAYAVQDTALDGVTAAPGRYRIYNTLQRIRQNIAPYLQRTVYIWLTTAVILLIFNGLKMVTTWIHDAGKFESIKKNLINIVIGVLLLTGFYVIFKLIIAGINALFGQS